MLVPSIALILGAPVVSAFLDSSPLLAWSSKEYITFENVSPSDYSHLFTNKDLCDFDAVILINQPGLRAQDLKVIPEASMLLSQIQQAPSSLQLPYVKLEEQKSVDDVADVLSSKCGSRIVWDGNSVSSLDTSSKHVILVTLPEVYGANSQRKDVMLKSDLYLSEVLEQIVDAFPKSFIIYTGSVTHSLYERQENNLTDTPFSYLVAKGDGILSRYQILTPGLIISLALVLFLLLPIVLLSVKALASVQSSVRLDVPKSTGQDKKNQ